MVGESVRFKKAGFKIPKFLLKINNKRVIEHIIDLFPKEKNFIFICNKKHLSDKKLRLTSILKKKCPHGKIFSVNSHKLGPVFSILKVIFADSLKFSENHFAYKFSMIFVAKRRNKFSIF